MLSAAVAGGGTFLALGLPAWEASARRVAADRVQGHPGLRSELAAAGVALVWLVAGSRLDTSLFRVYAGPTGQVLLAVMLGIVAAGLAGLARLDKGLAC